MKGKEPVFDGERLRAVRKERGLSAHDVSRRAKVTARHIWRLEAAVASALSRFEGHIGGSAAATTPAEEDDEVEDLLDAFQNSLVLGDD